MKQVYEEAVQVQLKSSGAIIVVDRNNLTEWTLPTSQLKITGNPDENSSNSDNPESKNLRGGRELIGRFVTILGGPHRCLLAVVKQVYEEAVQVQLKSNGAIIVVDRHNLTESCENSGRLAGIDYSASSQATSYEIQNRNPAHQIDHAPNIGGAHSMAVHGDGRSDSRDNQDPHTVNESDLLGKQVKVTDGVYAGMLGVVSDIISQGWTRETTAPWTRVTVKLKMNGERVPLYSNQFTIWPPTADPLPSNPANFRPQMDMGIGSASLPVNSVPSPHEVLHQNSIYPELGGNTVKIHFGPYKDQIAVVIEKLINSNKAKLRLRSNGNIVVVYRNHFKACVPEVPGVLNDFEPTTVKILDGPFKEQLGYVKVPRRGGLRDAVEVKLMSSGEIVMLYPAQFTACDQSPSIPVYPLPSIPGSSLPGNPAQTWPQSSGAQGIPGLIPIDNTGVPDILDSHAAKRESYPAKSSPEIVPDDEDTFRQYLRSLNQSRDRSPRPQQGSSGRRF